MKKRAKRSSSRKLPSWREVRAGLLQQTKLRLIAVIGRIFISRATPKSVKLKIVQVAKLGIKRVGTKRTRKSKTRKSRSRRTPAQIRATKKLIAFNKRRR